MPIVSSTPATSVTAGNVYSFTPTATNATSFSISNKPAWATFDATTGSLTGTPNNTNVGTTVNIVISATNSTGTVSLAAFSITVAMLPDTTAPVVSAFQVPATSTILVVPVTTLTATDNVGVTGYLLTDTSTAPSVGATGWSSTAPTSYTFSTAGSKTLYAWAKDAAGNASTSLVATVTVDATGPSLTLSTLADGAITNNSTLNISGTVSDPDGVAAVTINNASVSIAADGSFSSAITLHAGPNTITTVAVDTLGNQTKDIRTITLDKAAPVLTVTSPADNSVTAQQLVTVTGTINESSTVSVTVNSGTPQQASIAGTGFTQDVALSARLNTITIVATDLATNSTTVKRTVTYDNIKPSLTVTNPVQDITTSQSTLTLTGTVSDAFSSVTVIIAVDGRTFTPTVTQGAFSQQLTFSAEGTHAVTVTATDQVNSSSVNVTRNIIYTLPKPHVTINTTTSPTTSTSQTIGGTMDAGSLVAVTPAPPLLSDR